MRSACWAVVLILGMAVPAVADPDPTVQLLQAQPGNDGLAVAAARKAMLDHDLAKAEGYLRTCIAVPGDHRLASTELGWLRFLQGKPAEGLDLLKAAEKAPPLPLALSRLAWVYAQRGLRADAIRCAVTARKTPEGAPLALLTLGTVADDPANAKQYLLDAAAASQSPWPHYYLATSASGEDALKAYGESFARSLKPTDPFDIAAKGRSLTAISALVTANPKLTASWADRLDVLVTAHADHLGLSDMLIEAHIRSGKQEYAIAELRRRLGFASNKAEILRTISRLYVDLQQDELALASYDRTLNLLGLDQRSPFAHEVRCERVALMLGAGRDSEAGVELDRILKESPEHRRARLLKGLVMTLKQDWKQAQEAIAGIEPVSSEERLIVNVVRYRQGQGARWAQIFGASL